MNNPFSLIRLGKTAYLWHTKAFGHFLNFHGHENYSLKLFMKFYPD